jgi:hypothetical protein
MQLNVTALSGVKVLGKEAQKRISGGLKPGTCAFESVDGAVDADSISKADAIAGAAENGTHWCCDSCGSASWYNGSLDYLNDPD